jgi:hypothetical protein
MREITESQAWQMAEQELAGTEEDWPVLSKVEWDATESAVCVKQTKLGYILGVSCNQTNAFRIFYCDRIDDIMALASKFETEMRNSGNPLSGAVSTQGL